MPGRVVPLLKLLDRLTTTGAVLLAALFVACIVAGVFLWSLMTR